MVRRRPGVDHDTSAVMANLPRGCAETWGQPPACAGAGAAERPGAEGEEWGNRLTTNRSRFPCDL